ncbi:Uncharacterised protein [Orientia tsutsugamushi]|uniref:Uncharacterized protein n=1 Tax=Orientia tsutsugamushi TaxID=784 RepID=A0A2U3R751_ORITS|nr:hypothetical protein OTSUT76_2124 [Orientia tsutsugamushi str. UT76]SPR09045.1 Uncharacterised protein [Orientia tsutsugamushi]
MNLRIENILNAEADTPDKFCYMDKDKKLGCKKSSSLLKNSSQVYGK